MPFWKPFVSGVAVTAISMIVFQHYRENSKKKRPKPNIPETQNKELMDSPHLDMRMIRKAEGAIWKRTSRVTVVVERCTNDHNYSAILRTAEALGIQNVYIIAPPIIRTDEVLLSMKGKKIKQGTDEAEGRKLHHLYAQRATEWLTVREFENTRDCLAELRRTGHTIWATDLSQVATCLSQEELPMDTNSGSVVPEKVAVVFGTESVGCTAEMLSGCDLRVYLPLRGFADSLNLSVATALVIHHLFVLDPSIEGDMSDEERMKLRRKWFAKLAGKRLLTSRQKKDRAQLLSTIEQCRDIARKQAEHEDGSGVPLQAEQIAKLQTLPSLQAELSALEKLIETKAEEAVIDLINNPPPPLTDLRRHDEHRVAHISKSTRENNIEFWGGTESHMPATASYHTNENPSTANFFRNRVQHNNVTRRNEKSTQPTSEDSLEQM